MRAILTILLIWLAALLCLIGYSQYQRFKENRIFSGKGPRESLFVRSLVSAFMPPKNSKSYLVMEERLFILDPYLKVRDIVLAQLIGGIMAFILGIAITGTNVYLRSENAYQGNSKVPITLSKEEYEQITNGVTFDPNYKKMDISIINNNLKTITNRSTLEILSSSGEENLYEYLSNVDNTLSHLLKPQDLFLLAIMAVVGFFLPKMFMNFLYNTLRSNELKEFDALETTVYMMSTRPVYDILRDLEEQAMYYSSMIYKFRIVYERSHETAYEMVAGNIEFPDNFKRLSRYLNIIETSGAESARVAIEAHKTTTEERIFAVQQAIIRKRMFALKLITMMAFILAFIRVMVSMLAGIS